LEVVEFAGGIIDGGRGGLANGVGGIGFIGIESGEQLVSMRIECVHCIVVGVVGGHVDGIGDGRERKVRDGKTVVVNGTRSGRKG